MAELEVTKQGRVTVLTLRRPEAGNRLTQSMAESMTAALAAARRDQRVVGCVLTGHGKVFCLGGDYQAAGPTAAGRMEFGRAHIDLFNEVARLGKPLIAAVNGDAHAGGCALLVACDMAYIAEDATVGLPERVQGLWPFLALAVARQALPKKVLFEIIYHARLLSAQQACALHLANAVMAREVVLPSAIAAVERAAHGNPAVLALGRDLYYAMRGLSPAAALDASSFALFAALSARDDQLSGDA
jgi:enoyl-CoA hydratase/carnithine racemase